VSKENFEKAERLPEGMGAILSEEDLRDLVEFLATLK
jgi:hypothetical protein